MVQKVALKMKSLGSRSAGAFESHFLRRNGFFTIVPRSVTGFARATSPPPFGGGEERAGALLRSRENYLLDYAFSASAFSLPSPLA
jgi:hypothetical protein